MTIKKSKPMKFPYGIAEGTFDDLADRVMSPASRALARKRADAILQRMTLDESRKDRKVTQRAQAQPAGGGTNKTRQ